MSGAFFNHSPFRHSGWHYRFAGIAALIAALLASYGAARVHPPYNRTAGSGSPVAAAGASTSSSDPVSPPESSTAPPASVAPPAPPAASPPSHAQPVTPTTPSDDPVGASGGQPGPDNTGVPAGTSLTRVNGNQVFSTDGAVISGLDIHGYVRITGTDVTLKNSIVRGPDSVSGCSDAAVIEVTGSATIEDSEVAPTDANACLDGVWAQNTTLQRMDIHGTVDGVKAMNDTTVENSYLHDLHWFSSDPNQGGGSTHNDGVQTFDANSNVTIVHNFFDMDKQDNSDYQLTQDEGQPARNIRVEDNWLYGGDCSVNLSSKGGPAIASSAGIYVLDNRFGAGSSVFNCPILLSEGVALAGLSGNVWIGSGAAIPAPQVHN